MREIEEQVVEDKKDEFWHKIWRPASSAGKRCHIYAMQVHWTFKTSGLDDLDHGWIEVDDYNFALNSENINFKPKNEIFGINAK